MYCELAHKPFFFFYEFTKNENKNNKSKPKSKIFLYFWGCKITEEHPMLANQRRDKILELLKEDGSAKVADLSKIFKVTEVTIRQDLEKLEKDGSVIREHGGVYLKNVEDQVKSFLLANQENMDKKERIARKCLEFIESGDTIILDSGSTTTEIAKKLGNIKNLTVITNALNIALMLGANPNIEVVMTGGEFKPPTLSLTGQKAADFFHGLNVQKLFLATAGLSLKSGLTYPSISDLVVKKAMIDAADTTFLVADSTKIGKSAFASLGALSLIHYIITDPGIAEKHKKVFKDNDIELILSD
jgi:DeoR/GlpR family transcriptional regulator of sugar metabolism